MSKDGVTTAFEVILEEFEAVVAEVNDQGAQFIKSGKYDEATKLIESGKQLNEFRVKLEALSKEWLDGLNLDTRNRIKIDNVSSLTPHHKAAKTGLRVKFSNGKIINEHFAADTFALVLQEIGLDRVRALGKKLNDEPLISLKKHDTYSQYRIGNFYVMTHSNTKSKKRILEDIAQELGLKLEIEIVH